MKIKTKKPNLAVSFYNIVQRLNFHDAWEGCFINPKTQFTELCYLPVLFEPKENLDLLSKKNIIGGFLYSNSPEVVHAVRNFFQGMIVDEIIYDPEPTLKISFKLLIINMGEEKYRLIIEVKAIDSLLFL